MAHRAGWVILLVYFGLVQAGHADWTEQALKLSGASDQIRVAALRKLKGLPHLKTLLTRELKGPRKELALDVITALGLKEFVPVLIDLSDCDENSGVIELALNSLLDTENAVRILRIYRERLLSARSCPGRTLERVVLLDTLGQLQFRLSVQELQWLFHQGPYEVQSAVLDFIRRRVSQKSSGVAPVEYRELLALVKKGIKEGPDQLRGQAESLILEWQRVKRTHRSAKSAHFSRFSRTSHEPGALHVRIALGYKDTRPALFVGDRYERLLILQKLTRPCDSHEKWLCGFVQNSQDPLLLSKGILFRRKAPLIVFLYLTASSVGPNDQENRVNPYQQVRSRESELNFYSGLLEGNSVFYIGHSRDGGGPDFAPPLLDRRGHVHYGRYIAKKQAARKLSAILSATSKWVARNHTERFPTIGLMSCNSSRHFRDLISKTSERIHWKTASHLIYYTEAIDRTLEALVDLMAKASSDALTSASR